MEINEVTSKLTILQLVCVNSRRHLCNAYIFLKFDLFVLYWVNLIYSERKVNKS